MSGSPAHGAESHPPPATHLAPGAPADGGDDGRVRVLWLAKGLGPGGVERLLLSFARHADHSRFRFQVAYLLPWKGHLAADIVSCGVSVTRLRGGDRPALPFWVRDLRHLVVRDGIQVVHAHSPLVAGMARPALRLLPRPVRPALVGTEHNLWDSYHPATRWLDRSTLRLEDLTFAVSTEVRDSMAPPLRRRAEVLIHGIAVDEVAARQVERAQARAELDLPDSCLAVVTVANLRPNKDYPTLLRAARAVLDRGLDVRFLSVGQGQLAAEVERDHERLGLGRGFRLLGYRADPIRVLAAADVFCLASRSEGLPIALLEAMAVGLPVAATAVGGVTEVVRDGVEGVLVPPADPAALADAILSLLDPERRSACGKASAARARQFGVRAAVDRQQSAYEALAMEAGHRGTGRGRRRLPGPGRRRTSVVQP